MLVLSTFKQKYNNHKHSDQFPLRYKLSGFAGVIRHEKVNPIEKYGKDSINDRSLFVLELESPEAIKKFSLPATHFACLVAWDSESVADEKIHNLLDCIIASGAAYICCWGKGCERVHDTADEIDHS